MSSSAVPRSSSPKTPLQMFEESMSRELKNLQYAYTRLEEENADLKARVSSAACRIPRGPH